MYRRTARYGEKGEIEEKEREREKMKEIIKKSVKKGTAIFMTAILMTSIGFAMPGVEAHAAVAFTDIPASYWAKSEIAFAAEKGIVNGYEAGNGNYIFQPENSVSYEEAATMLYRSLEAAGRLKPYEAQTDESGAIVTLEAKYDDILNSANIAAWAREYVAYCIENEIIDKTELSAFVNAQTKLGNPAPRLDVAVWTAKALDKNIAGVVNLPYADASLIDDESAVYVDMLYRHGIMQGSLMLDGTVAFQPKSGVKRSEFAAIANRVFNNANLGYDAAKETFNYITDDDNSFYEGARIRIIAGLGTKMIGKYEQGVIVSGMTFAKGETPQAHYVGKPEKKSGTVVSAETLANNIMKVVISVNGEDISYLFDGDTVNTAKIKNGTKVTFIADGVKLIEVK